MLFPSSGKETRKRGIGSEEGHGEGGQQDEAHGRNGRQEERRVRQSREFTHFSFLLSLL